MPIYDVYSKRDKPLPEVYQYDFLPAKFRYQILWAWRKVFSPKAYVFIREILCEEDGVPCLSGDTGRLDRDFLCFFEDEASRVDTCLNAVELSLTCARLWIKAAALEYFNGEAIPYVSRSGSCDEFWLDLVKTMNFRFRENGIGYEYHAESKRLIRIDSLYVHTEAVVPALNLLTDPAIKSANDEFLEAHKDFRNGEYGDCLTKCGKAFESTLKILCDKNSWTYDPKKDTASKLVEIYMRESHLDGCFKDMLMVVPRLRNNFGAHGKGTATVTIPEHFAQYALHATASAILLLIEHAK